MSEGSADARVEETLWRGRNPERLISVVPVDVRLPKRAETPLSALARAGGVSDASKLGERPLTAAIQDPWNNHPELCLYIDLYGRDAAEAAEMVADEYPGVAVGTFLFAAAYQARSYNFWRQSFPGSYPHRVKHTVDVGRRANDPREFPFHGARDAAVLILKHGATLLRSGELAPDRVVDYPSPDPRAGQPVLRNGVPLTVEQSVVDATGGVISQMRHGLMWTPSNLGKEGWWDELDSYNAYTDWDGRQPEVPVETVNGYPQAWIAPLALQAQTYEALVAVADYLDGCGSASLDAATATVRDAAAELKHAVLEQFLVTDDPQGRGRYFASAVHELRVGADHPMTGEPVTEPGKLHALRSIRNTQGDLLKSGMLDSGNGQELQIINDIVRQLTHERLLTPIGLRGRSNDDPRYTPHDYHSSVWPQRTYTAAKGLSLYGMHRLAAELQARAMRLTKDGRYPESFAAEGDPICRHVLTVETTNPVRQVVRAAKERPPQGNQTWCIATVVAIDAKAGMELRPTDPAFADFEQELLATLPERAFRDGRDLQWSPEIPIGLNGGVQTDQVLG